MINRVISASVAVHGEIVGGISPVRGQQGLLVFVGVTHDDTPDTARALAEKIWRLRILDGERAAADVGAPILVISQFTLYANVSKGRRPSWNAAAGAAMAQPLLEGVVTALRDLGGTVSTGVFGAHMTVSSVNDGPVTIVVEL